MAYKGLKFDYEEDLGVTVGVRKEKVRLCNIGVALVGAGGAWPMCRCRDTNVMGGRG